MLISFFHINTTCSRDGWVGFLEQVRLGTDITYWSGGAGACLMDQRDPAEKMVAECARI